MTNLGLILFVCRLHCKNEKGNFQAIYAVTTQFQILEKPTTAKSAQQAELHALPRVNQLSEGQTVNFVMPWRQSNGWVK